MAKILITGDLHIHNHRNETRRIEDGLECLAWIYKTASNASIKHVVVAGDFFHNRFSLNTYAYARACGIVINAKKEGINTVFLLGNHDMFNEDNWEIHSLTSIKEWATVVDSPTTLSFDGDNVDFLPYTPKPSKYISQFKEPSKTLISHLAVADAVLNSKYDIKSVEDDSKEKEVISISAFAKWKKVWLGHYHYAQQLSETVEYIGSPMQLSFGEAGQVKHIAIFDTSTLETKYIDNDISPQFMIIDDRDQIPSSGAEDSYIQIRADIPLTDKFDIKKSLSKLGAREIEFCGTKQELIQDETAGVLKNIEQLFNNKEKLLDEYFKCIQIPPEIDQTVLKKLALEVVNA